ncbi:MAG: pyroglutamyl-peptidase I [Planctomycetota bacterium]|jgi:pyroglutamyl-peptidase|nr:pyroglutamyl-peptidase I [Planctomycetota bacterium]
MKGGGRPRILVTGFEPFADVRVNASERLVASLVEDPPAGVDLVTEILPTVFERSAERVEALLADSDLDAYLALGVAREAAALRLEEVAVNRQESRRPDNDGVRATGEPVVAGGPPSYRTTLPTEALAQALEAVGVAVEISQSAGTFVCNHVFYRTQWEFDRSGRSLPAGFIHLPHLPEEATRRGVPAMSLEKMHLGITVVIDCLRRLIEAEV